MGLWDQWSSLVDAGLVWDGFGVWTDWGTSDWANPESDLSVAVGTAQGWLDQTAQARGWDDNDVYNADAIIGDAASASHGDIAEFWNELAAQWPKSSEPAGWNELGKVFGSADATAVETKMGKDGGNPADAPDNRWKWALLAGAGVGVYLLVRR
jgi:hypothetical protein